MQFCDSNTVSMMWISTRRAGWLACLTGLLTLFGCGGGGGSGTNSVNVIGIVLRAETNTSPNPAATVALGGRSATTDANTGAFTLTAVPANATTLTITAQGTQTRTLTVALNANNATNDLGNLFVSDTGYTATVIGKVVALAAGQTTGVGNATVILAGAQTTTATDGTFTLSNLPIGLGNASGATIGKVTATGFDDKIITSDTIGAPLVTGNNNIGNLLLGQPIGSTPLPPYTIKITVTANGQPQPNASVQLLTNGNILGQPTTDSNGNFFFWVVPGDYMVKVTETGFQTQQVSVNPKLMRLDTPVSMTIQLVP